MIPRVLAGMLALLPALVGAVSDPSPFVSFSSGNWTLDRAFRIAHGDLLTNIQPHKSGLLEEETQVVLAGLEYGRPWTRDSALNTWNGAGLLYPEVTRSTLLSVLEKRDGGIFIGGQYWDQIVWAVGAWAQYLFTGDKEFLAIALEAVTHSLEFLEATEFDPDLNLFRGAASSSDGVAGYPPIYAQPGGFSGISEWPRLNPERAHKTGRGLPMHALSTNCLYYQAYVLVEKMAEELGEPVDPHWREQAGALKKAINERFWLSDTGLYRYLVDPLGDCDYTECLGHAYALTFGIADPSQAQQVLKNHYRAPAGVPVLWPTFERYRIADFQDGNQSGFGRHSGCIWPPFEAIWATAAESHGRADLFMNLLEKTAEFACRDSQFEEMYHPISGEAYGGLQEGGGNERSHQLYGDSDYKIGVWQSRVRQTWSATGFIRMILFGLLGMEFSPEGVQFDPVLPEGYTDVSIRDLPYRGMTLDIHIEGPGTKIAKFSLNGVSSSSAFLTSGESGMKAIHIQLIE